MRLLIKAVVFVAIFILLEEGLAFLVFPRDSLSKTTINELHQHNDLDLLFVGTSSTYHSNIPLLVDEVAGVKSFNVTTPAQSFMASYYLLKEALKQNKISCVVLYVNAGRFVSNRIDDVRQFQAIENMGWSFDKLEFLIRGFTIDKYPDALLKSYRARENMRPGFIINNLTYTGVLDPKDYPAEIFSYLGKGYAYLGTAQKPGEVVKGTSTKYDAKKIRPENMEYLNRIISLCKESNIDLIFLSRPKVAANVIGDGNYGEFHDYVQKLADENSVPFWDLTYIRQDVLKMDDTMFADGQHTNYTLAMPLSRLLGKMLKEYEAGTLNVSDYLFDSYDEYLQINNRITGVYTGSVSQNRMLQAYAAIGAGIEPEFRFLLSSSRNGEYKVIQDWSTKDKVDLNGQPRRKCWLMVEARRAGSNGESEQRTRKEIDLR